MKSLKKIIKYLLIGLAGFSVIFIGVYIYFIYLLNSTIAVDSTLKPPFKLHDSAFPDSRALKAEIIHFNSITNISPDTLGLEASRVMPKLCYSGINGWDYITYPVTKENIFKEIQKWQNDPDRVTEQIDSSTFALKSPPQWWPDSSKLKRIVFLKKTGNEYINFQQVFLNPDNNQIYFYNDWGN